MLFSGFCSPVRPGGTCRLITVIGKTPDVGFADGETWEGLLEQLAIEPDYEWLMIDGSHIKVHPHASGAKGSNQDMAVTKGGSTARYI